MGCGCPNAMTAKKITNNEFIRRAKIVHGDKYDYSKVVYQNMSIKVCIICPEHGEFYQVPSDHLRGHGCSKCARIKVSYIKKLTTQDFISKARKVHGDKYDYSKTNYIGSNIKICIICPEHGEFWQIPHSHLNGSGCPKCGIERAALLNTSTAEKFIKKAKEIHENKYDYSKVAYKNSRTKVCIICPEHGEFWQIPNDHLHGKGCSKCVGNKKLSNAKFIEKSSKIHNGKYDYSKVVYKNNRTKVCIICPEHGKFWQKPNDHLMGHGCPKCTGNKRLTNAEFTEKARKIHGNKYVYSKVEYKSNKVKIRIICPIHGEFWQTPSDHLNGHGCPKCAIIKKSVKNKKELEKFIEDANRKHNYKYDYSKVEYENNKVKICIICPIHGEFWQIPNSHLAGHGCPKCNFSHLEKCTMKLLDNNCIKYETQKRFEWLITKKKGKMSLDFFLPDYNTAIECQGIQHYNYTENGFFTKNIVEKTKQRDNLKKLLCQEHGVYIYYIRYDEDINKSILNLTKILRERRYGENATGGVY